MANPYSTPMPVSQGVVSSIETRKTIKEERHHTANGIASELYQLGYTLIEPIASSHYKSLKFHLPGIYDYWKKRDRALIKISDGLMVVNDLGWEESVGVTDEISFCRKQKKPVYLVSFDCSNSGRFSITSIKEI